MSSTFKVRGTWRHGVTDQFVDVKALDIFLRILPWALAIEAIVRGWEFLRVAGVTSAIFPNGYLRGQVGEEAFGFEMFGLTFIVAGLLLIAGMLMRRFGVIISACLIGMASYLLLSVSFLVEAFFGSSGTGARTGFTFLVFTFLWVFKGLFSASKKSVVDIQKEAGTLPKETA